MPSRAVSRRTAAAVVAAAALRSAPAVAQPPSPAPMSSPAAAAQTAAPQAASPQAASPRAGSPRVRSEPTARAGAFLLSAGVDLWANDFGDRAPGFAAHAAFERRVGGPRSRFAVRLDGDYWRTGRTFTGYDQLDGLRPLDVRRTTTVVGGSLLGVVRLRALGRFRPYALGGVGVHQYSNRNETDWVPLGGGAASKVVYFAPVRVTSPSYIAGAGASARVGHITPFAELRVLSSPALGRYGSQGVRTPLTLGARVPF